MFNKRLFYNVDLPVCLLDCDPSCLLNINGKYGKCIGVSLHVVSTVYIIFVKLQIFGVFGVFGGQWF